MYGDHPYGRELPAADEIARSRRPSCARCTAASRRPAACSRSSATSRRPRRSTSSSGAVRLVGHDQGPDHPGPARGADRSRAARRPPGAVQTTLRMAASAPSRTDPTTRPSCWPTWSSAATSPRAGWPTSARTRATPTARTRRSSTRRPARASP
jgi:hypothetical protein